MFVAPSKILDGKILSLILVICGKKEDNATIYQVTEIKQKLSSLLWIVSDDLLDSLGTYKLMGKFCKQSSVGNHIQTTFLLPFLDVSEC